MKTYYTRVPTVRCSLRHLGARWNKQENVISRKLDHLCDILLLGTQLNYTFQLLLRLNGLYDCVLTNEIGVEGICTTFRPDHKNFLAIFYPLSFPTYQLNGEDSKHPEKGSHRKEEPGFPSPYLEESHLTGTPTLDCSISQEYNFYCASQ